jgi:RNA recognition motif-containing protein
MTESADAIAVGKTVECVGTSSASMNGSVGTIVSWNTEKERWAVDFGAGVGVKNLFPKNLKITTPKPKIDPNAPPPTNPKIYVTGLSEKVTEDDLEECFKVCGNIAKIPQKTSRGAPDGFPDQWPPSIKMYKPGRKNGDALIEYEDPYAAAAAVRMKDGVELHGAKIKVELASYDWKQQKASQDDRGRGRDRDGDRDRRESDRRDRSRDR